MKTQEQQKAELCDRMMYVLRNNLVSETLMGFVSEYDQITQQKPLSRDPYADEVFSGRLYKIIKRELLLHAPIKLSRLPHIEDFDRIIGFGKMMRQEYTEVMTKYGFIDKI